MHTQNTERKAERHEHPSVMLKRMLSEETHLINEQVRGIHQLEHLLNSDGSLNVDGYTEVYGEQAIKMDKKTVQRREVDFSNAHNERVKEFYRTKYGASTEDEIIAHWKENKTHEKGGQMEMAVTLLLSRMLGNDFLIVRTAPLDDYGGMDNLILDSVTGEVVGAFDEVHEGGEGRRLEEKRKKIQKIAEHGGAKVRYGIKLEEGKLKRTKLEGVPVFYLGLESSQLDVLVNALQMSDVKSMKEIFAKLTHSLQEQHHELSTHTVNPQFQIKLENFAKLLTRITPIEMVT